MERILEPELMEDEDQVVAYAEADFEEPHSHFIKLFGENFSSRPIEGYVLDLGCGPGDITCRFADAYPECVLHAVDGSQTMLKQAQRRLASSRLTTKQITFFQAVLPDIQPPNSRYDYLISNSLLHHLPDPGVLWSVISRFSRTGSGVFVMDLLRPENSRVAKSMVDLYAANEPEVLQRDFYNSLLAAFTLEEISVQLIEHRLDFLNLKQVSDRHVTVSGRIP